jgi:hypothetical protein
MFCKGKRSWAAMVCIAFGVMSVQSVRAEPKAKVIILDLKMAGVETEEAKTLKATLGGILAKSVTNLGYEVISPADLQAMIGLERLKDLVGCESDTACLTELGGALGADLLIGGSVGKLGKIYNVTLSLVDNNEAKSKGRFQGEAGTASALTKTIKRGVAILFERTKEVRTTGMLLIKTTPSGAKLTLDGKPIGQSPITLDVPAGDHEILATLEGMSGIEQVLIKPSEVTKTTIMLTTPPVSLRVSTDPAEAKFFIDGAEVGTTPFITESTASGEHTFRFELDGYAPKEMTVDLNLKTYQDSGKEPLVYNVKLRRRWPVEPGLVLGGTGNLDRMADGLAAHAELTLDVAEIWQLGFGFTNPGSLVGNLRSYVYRDGFELGGLLQFAMFDRISALEVDKGIAAGGGLSTGLSFELPVGQIGARLELTALYDIQKGGLSFPIHTGVFWRMK